MTIAQPNHKPFTHAFIFALSYGLFFYALQFILYRLHIIQTLPNATNLVAWDANWYQDMVNYGTRFWKDTNSSAGFFPLFPLFWKVLGLNGATASVFNLVCFSVGFGIFNTLYVIDWKTKLVWLTIPSFYFAWVPYTEALFVLLVAVSFWGIMKGNRWAIWTGLFLLALTRPTTLVLVPALFIMQLLINPKDKWLSAVRSILVLYALPLLAGLALFILYQYYATGVWFAYFKLQSTAWGHKFSLPVLPFGSMFGLRHMWLNAAALFAGFVCLLWLIKVGVQWLLRDQVQRDKLLLLSALYFVGMSFTTLLFNPTWGINATNVFDIHRYAFVSPFFWVLLYSMSAQQYRLKHYMAALLLCNVFWLLFGSYCSMHLLGYYNLATLAVLVYMLVAQRKIFWFPFVVMAVNLCIQVWLFQGFISEVYPG